MTKQLESRQNSMEASRGPHSEDEDVTGSESWRARYVLDRAELAGILSRQDEVAAASTKGRKRAEGK